MPMNLIRHSDNQPMSGLVLILIDSHQSSEKLTGKISSLKFHFNTKFLVYFLYKSDFESFENIFKAFWKKMISNVNIVYKTNSTQQVLMSTFMPFVDGKCGQTSSRMINEFNVETRSWQSTEFFQRKFINLQNCPINIGTVATPSPPAVIVIEEDGKIKLAGFESAILNEVSEKLNFSLNIFVDKELPRLYENRSAYGLFRKMQDDEIDISFTFLSLHQLRSEVFSASYPRLNDKVIAIISPKVPIEPLVMLVLPFKDAVWNYFSILIAAAILILLLGKCFKFGKLFETKHPIIDMTSIIFGSSQGKLPVQNFARILTASFLLFCLVLRTGYSGELYKIIRSDPGIKIRSFSDLKNYEFQLFVMNDMLFIATMFTNYKR